MQIACAVVCMCFWFAPKTLSHNSVEQRKTSVCYCFLAEGEEVRFPAGSPVFSHMIMKGFLRTQYWWPGPDPFPKKNQSLSRPLSQWPYMVICRLPACTSIRGCWFNLFSISDIWIMSHFRLGPFNLRTPAEDSGSNCRHCGQRQFRPWLWWGWGHYAWLLIFERVK